MSDRELRILNDLAAAFRDICNDCDGIPEKYLGLYEEACRAVRPLTDGQAAIVPPDATIPREVADRLAEELQNIANLDDDAADMAPLMASLALAEYRKAMPDDRCPWCGAGWVEQCDSWECGQRLNSPYRAYACSALENAALRARVTRLESALRTIADTNDAGTLPGDMARGALRADA